MIFFWKNYNKMGIGDWGLGIGDWGLGPIPNPQSPIPILNEYIYLCSKKLKYFNKLYILIFILIF